MKFNKLQKDNIIKMSNQEAKEIIDSIDNLVSFSEFLPTGEASKSIRDLIQGLKNLSEID